MPNKPVKYRAVVKLSYEDGSVVEPGKLLTVKQAARLEDEDAWLLEQELVERVGES
jgi:hypothetical protein